MVFQTLHSTGVAPLVLAVATIMVWGWLVIASWTARGEFVNFLHSQPFRVKVTSSPDLDGPVDALIVDDYDAASLPEPTDHQIWWGLLPRDHLDLVQEDVHTLLRTRNTLFFLMIFSMITQLVNLFKAIFMDSSVERLHPLKVFGALFFAGPNTIVMGSNFCSMFGVYMDPSLALPVVNYVPGWAYVWFCVLLLVLVLLPALAPLLAILISPHLVLVAAALTTAAFVYWLFWLAIPLVGYAWIFSWRFVDDVVQQELSSHGAVDLALSEARHIQLHDATAEGLGSPFSAAVWCGVASMLYGLFGLATSLPTLLAELERVRRAQADDA